MSTLSTTNTAPMVAQTAGTLPERAAPAASVKEVSSASASVEVASSSPSRESVVVAAQQIESFVKTTNRNLSFSVDESLGVPVVKVMDPETQDVIRQIPAEETLRIAKSLEFLNSVLVQQKA